MLPSVPLPAWSDFKALISGPALDDQTLAAPWAVPDRRATWYSRAAWAMEHIVLDWRARHADGTPTVWLPDYFCNQSTQPMRVAGARLVFYPVGHRLTPDWTRLESLAMVEPPDFFILVHYFGSVNDLQQAKKFCDEFEVELIEDASHVLVPHTDIGTAGSHVFFSPYKFFAVPDAGLLLSRRDLSPPISAAGRSPSGTVWITKRLLQKVAPSLASILSRRPPAFDVDPTYTTLARHTVMSLIARRLLSGMTKRIPEIAVNRRRVADEWRDVISEGPSTIRPLFEAAETEGPAPYRFVAVAENPMIARRAYDKLLAQGCPVGTWPDLAPEVLADEQRHAQAISFRNRLILMPVHASMPVKKLVADLF